jgi:hypothetical protein
MLAQLVTLALLVIFLLCGYEAHWFDLILSSSIGTPDVVAIVRALVSLAGLLGWAMRNEFVRGT